MQITFPGCFKAIFEYNQSISVTKEEKTELRSVSNNEQNIGLSK